MGERRCAAQAACGSASLKSRRCAAVCLGARVRGSAQEFRPLGAAKSQMLCVARRGDVWQRVR
eukprot:8183544-Alexandrium_andersonii.AAC.1